MADKIRKITDHTMSLVTKEKIKIQFEVFICPNRTSFILPRYELWRSFLPSDKPFYMTTGGSGEDYQVAKCLIDWGYIQKWKEDPSYELYAHVFANKVIIGWVALIFDIVVQAEYPKNDNMPNFKPNIAETIHDGLLPIDKIVQFSKSNLDDNGIDITFANSYIIQAAGMLILRIQLEPPGFGWSERDRPNLFMLRSSTAKYGIIISNVSAEGSTFAITLSNLSNEPIRLGERFIQIVLDDYYAFNSQLIDGIIHKNKIKKPK